MNSVDARFAPQSTGNVTKIANLTMPNGEKTRLTFGTEFFKNEGKLLKEEVLSTSGVVLRTTDNSYAINPVTPIYNYVVGERILTKNSDDFDSTHVTGTATEAKELLQAARGNMDRRIQYTTDPYRKGFEMHNNQNSRETSVGNDLQHLT